MLPVLQVAAAALNFGMVLVASRQVFQLPFQDRSEVTRTWQILLKGLPEVQTATRPFAAAEMVLVRLAYAADLPTPDLFIRTGGDMRVSNFLLWQLAYTELWFTETLWPELDAATLRRALDDFASRERRFGLTGEQAAGSQPRENN